MRKGQTRHGRAVGRRTSIAAAAILTLAISATALAAKPKAGKKYTGSTTASKLNGFNAPVSFKVSSNGSRLTGFQYSDFGCLGAGGGGFQPGVNYYLKPFNLHKLGTILMATNGSFSVTNVKTTYVIQGQKTVTTSSVTGKFKTSKTATGTITFSQKFTAPHLHGESCGPTTVSFTAKTK
jgi:hypothetical protein